MWEMSKRTEWVIVSLLSVGIGLVVGAVDTLFGRVLLAITEFRQEHFIYLIPFLAPVGMLFIYLFLTYGKTSSQGMGLIFQAGQEGKAIIPKRLTPFVIVGTWLTHLFGGSAGREGVAVQLGAAIAHQVSRFFKKMEPTQFIVIGMAAGFGGLFETPIAATFFAIEVLVVGKLRYESFFPALVAAMTASWVSASLGLEKFSFALTTAIELDYLTLGKLILLGAVFSLVGRLFARSLKQMKTFFTAKITNPILRIGVGGLLLSILLFLLMNGRYSGLGINLINLSFQEGPIYSYDWLLKLLLTILTISVGFQGGEVTPLFAIGASLGALLAPFVGLPVGLVAALGYVAVFASATNTLLAPIFIGGEVFGFAYLPYFVIVCSLAFALNGNESIYGKQQILE